MPRVEDSIVINRSPDEVFSFVTDPANDRIWSSTAVERHLEGPLAVGSRIRAVDRFLGRRIEGAFEITEHEPPRLSSIRFVGGPLQGTGSYVLDPVDGGTRFRWVMEAESGLGGLYLGRATDPLVTWIFRRRLQGDLRRLKAVLEARSPSQT